MSPSPTNFDTGHDEAFRKLGAKVPGRQWSSFDVSMKEAREGKATRLVTTIWNYHRKKSKYGRRIPSSERGIVKDLIDGTFWYWVERPSPKSSRKTHTAHWNRMDLAFENGIPIIGVLKDAQTGRCSLSHPFNCDERRFEPDGKRFWLRLRPRSDVGCDVGVIDIRLKTASWPTAKDADEIDLTDDPGYMEQDGDSREVALHLIKKRRGQKHFRDALLRRYKRRCLVTGCMAVDVLEAAHIDPYRSTHHNHPENGLLLRADIHTLFDLDLLGIEPDSLGVELHPDIVSEYRDLVARTLDCAGSRRPSLEALGRRYELFKKRVRKHS